MNPKHKTKTKYRVWMKSHFGKGLFFQKIKVLSRKSSVLWDKSIEMILLKFTFEACAFPNIKSDITIHMLIGV